MRPPSTRLLPRAAARGALAPALPAALLAALLLPGCAPQQPLQRPAPPVPAAFPVAAPAAGLDAARTHWRAFFTDPRLQALIAAALEHNRDLRIAAARVQEARAQYGIARADRLPTVNAMGQVAVQRSSPELSGVDAATNSNRYDLALSMVSFELDFWGRVARLSEAARASFLATEEARRALQLSLVADVAGAYFAQLQADEAEELARATLALREQSLALLREGRDIGGVQEYEVQQAIGALESARAQLAAAEHQQALTQHQLDFLVGTRPAALPPGQPLTAQGLEVAIAPGIPSEVLLLRPDVMAAEQRLAAAHANIGAARAAFFPKVLLTAGLGFASPALATLLAGSAWNFQPAVTLPLFDGGRNAASLDMAQARQQVAVAEYEKTIQLAFREVADQLSARAALARQLQAAQASRSAQGQRLRIAQARHQAGLSGYLEVLDAQRELLAAQQAALSLRRAQLDAAARLYKALGGGSLAAAAG